MHCLDCGSIYFIKDLTRRVFVCDWCGAEVTFEAELARLAQQQVAIKRIMAGLKK